MFYMLLKLRDVQVAKSLPPNMLLGSCCLARLTGTECVWKSQGGKVCIWDPSFGVCLRLEGIGYMHALLGFAVQSHCGNRVFQLTRQKLLSCAFLAKIRGNVIR